MATTKKSTSKKAARKQTFTVAGGVKPAQGQALAKKLQMRRNALNDLQLTFKHAG